MLSTLQALRYFDVPVARNSADDRALIEQSALGHAAALEELMRRHQAPVYRFMGPIGISPADAEDVLQETFIAAWRGALTHRALGAVRSWLFSVARNAASHHLRLRAGEPVLILSLGELAQRAGWGEPIVESAPELPDARSSGSRHRAKKLSRARLRDRVQSETQRDRRPCRECRARGATAAADLNDDDSVELPKCAEERGVASFARGPLKVSLPDSVHLGHTAMHILSVAPRVSVVAALVAVGSHLSLAQRPDTATRRGALPTVVVTASRPLHVIGHMPALEHNVILTGKKTEVIVMDSLRANVAQDVERQILGRIPGANFSETEGAGFPSNGVAFRGLDPTQSVEMNVRQDGINIAADLFGYPETYYTPPSEALERIDVVRGAASLAFGPQFGGVIDYVVRDGQTNTAPQFSSTLTGGSFGLVNSFNSLAGGTRTLTYYAFFHGRRADGWRPNSDFRQLAGFGRLTYRPTARLTLGAEYTVFRNRIHMAGGLTDSIFAVNPRASLRARNWLRSPWNVAALRANYALSSAVRWENTLSFVDGSRALVWRNEDGGPAAPDLIDPETGEPIARELEDETFRTLTLESRLRVDHSIGGRTGTLATGLRFSGVSGRRFEGGTGSTGSDFDMQLADGTWETALRLGTTNAAAFAEEMVQLTDRLSVVPGVRVEHVRSTITGQSDGAAHFAPRSYSYPLAGVGLDYITSGSTELYANVSQAYRPILYSAFTPVGTTARIDPALHSSRGGNADVGWRGTLHDVVKFDVSGFYLWYGQRIGTRTGTDASGEFVEVTNIGDSDHRGIETYVELDPFPLLGLAKSAGALDLFSSLGYVNARYVSGEFRGNRVEQAPRILARFGATYGIGRFSTTTQVSQTSDSFGDANNSVQPTEDASGGLIPAYTLLDWSVALRLAHERRVSFGINNLTDTRYFTKRTAEYPGPGILPGVGRSLYLGVGAAF